MEAVNAPVVRRSNHLLGYGAHPPPPPPPPPRRIVNCCVLLAQLCLCVCDFAVAKYICMSDCRSALWCLMCNTFKRAAKSCHVLRFQRSLCGQAHMPCHVAGDQFRYIERARASNSITAALIGVGTAFLGLLLPLAAQFSFLRKLLPTPGSGPSRKTMESGHFDVANFSRGTDSSGKSVVVETHLKVRTTSPEWHSTPHVVENTPIASCVLLDKCRRGSQTLAQHTQRSIPSSAVRAREH